MLQKILGALLPAVITILLGYFTARHHDFSQKEVPTLNRIAGYKIVVNTPVLVLAFIKNVVQPGLVCAGMLSLGYGDLVLGEAVVTSALPPVTLVVMLAVQYPVAIPETASALLLSTLGSLLTMSALARAGIAEAP